jgi:hypothetical protein
MRTAKYNLNNCKVFSPFDARVPAHSGGVLMPIAVVPVAPLRKEAKIAEPLHQRDPGGGDPLTPQPVAVGLSGKPKPGSDGTTTWNASEAFPP